MLDQIWILWISAWISLAHMHPLLHIEHAHIAHMFSIVPKVECYLNTMHGFSFGSAKALLHRVNMHPTECLHLLFKTKSIYLHSNKAIKKNRFPNQGLSLGLYGHYSQVQCVFIKLRDWCKSKQIKKSIWINYKQMRNIIRPYGIYIGYNLKPKHLIKGTVEIVPHLFKHTRFQTLRN